MENSKLMIPLFYKHSFNREGRKMRAVFERAISDGKQSYWLWRSAGKPDLEYPRTENDKYLLYVEIRGYLLPLNMTDFDLVNHCGFEAMVKNLYGGNEERKRRFGNLRKSGGDEAVRMALAEEAKEIERCGNDPALQTEYIRILLNGRVSTYLTAKENGGQTFPDFAGALVIGDLARCVELSAVYRAKQQAEAAAKQARAAEEDKAYCAEQNQEAEQAVSAAIQVIRDGGILKNDTVKFYRGRCDASVYSIVNYLMRRYQVEVPLRTQGWINKKLSSATIREGQCSDLRYLRAKNGKASQQFFDCMDDLIRAVTAQPPEEAV